MVKPKKRLGQHFLTDPAVASRITDLLIAEQDSVIVEVGPGTGVLTRNLAERENKEIVVVEVDKESVEYLEEHFKKGEIRIIAADFLKTDLLNFGRKISLIGNFPYNISSQIFFHTLKYRDQVEEIVCMLQKEVGLRLASGPGNKQYGILSVLLQTWYSVEVCFHVKPGSFFPPPEVHSTVIRLSRNQRKNLPCDEKLYLRVIKQGFNQRRKVLRNSLKSILVNLDSDIPFLKSRPEELTPDQFIELCCYIESTNE